MRLITDPGEIQALLRRWKDETMAAGARTVVRTIGWPGGSRMVTMYWLASPGFWVAFEQDGNHYWNPCGLQSPLEHKEPHTVCDISIPVAGEVKQIRCAFTEDGGHSFIIHRGGIGRGGNPRGMTREAFFQHFRGETTYLGRKDRVAVVAQIGSKTFFQDFAGFLQEYQRLKDLLKQQVNRTA
jgi:hypothetical protein